MPQPLASQLVLYAGCLPATPFRDLVAAAAGAGFDAITLWPLMYRRAQSREGLTPPEMRRILDDHGIVVSDVDPCGDWLPAGPDAPTSGVMKAEWTRHQFFEAAAVLGATTMAAVHLTGGTVSHQQAVDGFGALCDDAAEHDMRVGLEFLPFSGIPGLADGWAVVRDADRANGGLVFDVWHYVRSGRDDALLRTVPADRFFSIQLSDGPAVAPGDDLLEEAMWSRLPPGDGEMDVAGILDVLRELGVSTRVGPELYRRDFAERPAADVARELIAVTRRVVEIGARG